MKLYQVLNTQAFQEKEWNRQKKLIQYYNRQVKNKYRNIIINGLRNSSNCNF